MFRRAAFGWAQSTKKLVESSAALGLNTKVAHAALEDIEYARDLLDGLFMPKASKVPATSTERQNSLTAKEVQACVSDLVARVVTVSACAADKPKVRRGVDLSAPVYPREGKTLWAGIDCSVCPSKATKRCQNKDGTFREKPHPQRKVQAEAMASVSSLVRSEEHNQD